VPSKAISVSFKGDFATKIGSEDSESKVARQDSQLLPSLSSEGEKI
jgi:hypothetical protein